jgi:hypothetical protein
MFFNSLLCLKSLLEFENALQHTTATPNAIAKMLVPN